MYIVYTLSLAMSWRESKRQFLHQRLHKLYLSLKATRSYFHFYSLIGILTCAMTSRASRGYTNISIGQIYKALQKDPLIDILISKAVSTFFPHRSPLASCSFWCPTFCVSPLAFILHETSRRSLRQLCLMSGQGVDHMSKRHVQLIRGLVVKEDHLR